jgi:hypothetical protein
MTLVLVHGEGRRVLNEKPTNSNLFDLRNPTINMMDGNCKSVVFSI